MESSCGGHSFSGRGNDDACVLNFGLGGEFLIGKHDELREGRLEEAFEREAKFGCEYCDGGEALLGEGV